MNEPYFGVKKYTADLNLRLTNLGLVHFDNLYKQNKSTEIRVLNQNLAHLQNIE